MRLTIAIDPRGDAGWTATYAVTEIPGYDPPAARDLEPLAQAPWVRGPGAAPVEEVARRLAEATRRLAIRDGHGGDPAVVGRHLHDTLFDAGEWDRLRVALTAAGAARTLELAIRCDTAERQRNLHAVPWELLYDGERFLAAHPDLSIAVTRVVAGSSRTEPDAIESPPRVLFAIGSSLTDDSIRAGAEFAGLMRRVRDDRRATDLDVRVVENASPTRIAEAVTAFEPDIVNFISHGRLTASGRGVLMLPTDEGDTGEATADRLLAALSAGQRLPRIAVVTGCESGMVQGNGAEPQEIDAHAAPLAAELVAGGIPITVGMTGRVADRACRLFTRQFGAVLMSGARLVDALADARRAAYSGDRKPAEDSVDWALPSLFLADGVPPGHVPVDTTRGSQIVELTRGFKLHDDPVFCGRRGFYERFDELIDPRHPMNALVACAPKQARGLGESRVLHELAAHALRRGHVPIAVLMRSRPGVAAPTSTGALAHQLAKALNHTRRQFGLPPGVTGALLGELTARAGAGPGDQADLELRETSALDAVKDVADFPADLLRTAFAGDVAALLAKAREMCPTLVTDASCAVVFLDRVDTWGDALDALFHDLIEGYGLSDLKQQRVPVVMSCMLDGDGHAVLQNARNSRPAGIGWEDVGEFSAEDGEDTLAFEWVLLNPPRGLPWDNAKHVYAPKDPSDARWKEDFREMLVDAVPGVFVDRTFWSTANVLTRHGLFERDVDDQILEAWERQRNP